MSSRIEVFITDHSPDRAEIGDYFALRNLYSAIKAVGISSVRYDWRWKLIEPAQDTADEAVLERYAMACRANIDAGLAMPTLVLSSIPDWALKIYKSDKPAFFVDFERYVTRVKNKLVNQYVRGLAPHKIACVQVLNELNMFNYTPVEQEDIPHLCDIVRDVFADYNPDLKLLGSVIVNNLLAAV